MALPSPAPMPSIQIKNVPPEVHRVLRRRAAEEGQSLQEYLLARLSEEAQLETPAEVFDRIERERSGGSLSPALAAELVREGRGD